MKQVLSVSIDKADAWYFNKSRERFKNWERKKKNEDPRECHLGCEKTDGEKWSEMLHVCYNILLILLRAFSDTGVNCKMCLCLSRFFLKSTSFLYKQVLCGFSTLKIFPSSCRVPFNSVWVICFIWSLWFCDRRNWKTILVVIPFEWLKRHNIYLFKESWDISKILDIGSEMNNFCPA